MFSFREIRIAALYMLLTMAAVVGVVAVPVHYWAPEPKQIAEADIPRAAVEFPEVGVVVKGKTQEMTVEQLLFNYLKSQGEQESGASVKAISSPTGC